MATRRQVAAARRNLRAARRVAGRRAGRRAPRVGRIARRAESRRRGGWLT